LPALAGRIVTLKKGILADLADVVTSAAGITGRLRNTSTGPAGLRVIEGSLGVALRLVVVIET
jgi:hypothetical protein